MARTFWERSGDEGVTSRVIAAPQMSHFHQLLYRSQSCSCVRNCEKSVIAKPVSLRTAAPRCVRGCSIFERSLDSCSRIRSRYCHASVWVISGTFWSLQQRTVSKGRPGPKRRPGWCTGFPFSACFNLFRSFLDEHHVKLVVAISRTTYARNLFW